MTPRHVHVLFVHGVGKQSRLASLLKPYQSLRAQNKSISLPLPESNLAPNWQLEQFDDHNFPSCLVLKPKEGTGSPKRVYLYEVNYAHLAEVIRKNHRIDLTQLFVRFNMEVTISALRLKEQAKVNNTLQADLKVAQHIRTLSNILLAGTIPILGFLPVLAKQFNFESVLNAFVRFFEDVVTFAMDRTGFELIASHFESTITRIKERGTDHFNAKQDEFILVSHSLGTVVAHNYLVKFWKKESGREIPINKMITCGSPIGLLCWLWLLIEHREMDFSKWEWDEFAKYPDGVDRIKPFFVWDRKIPEEGALLHKILWINVLNPLDPIATRFRQSFCFLSLSNKRVAVGLEGDSVQHFFINQGWIPGLSHTKYYDHRPATRKIDATDAGTFLELLSSIIGLTPGLTIKPTTAVQEEESWRRALKILNVWRWTLVLCGIGLFVWAFSDLVEGEDKLFWLVLVLLSVVYWRLSVWILAAFQKLIWGYPSEKISRETIKKHLPWYSAYVRRPPWRVRPKWLFQMVSVVVAGLVIESPRMMSFFLAGPRLFEVKQLGKDLLYGSVFTILFALAELLKNWAGIVKALSLAGSAVAEAKDKQGS